MEDSTKYTIDVENLNIHIENSYLVTDKSQIRAEIKKIMGDPKFQDLKAAGFTRTSGSMYNEWAAHNVLYRWGYEKERTKSVDIDQKETTTRKFCYWILAKF